MPSSWATYTPPERETVIQWDEESSTVRISTAQRRTSNVLAKRGYKPVRTHTVQGKIHWMEFEVPYDQFRWGFKSKRKPLTEEQRTAAAERIKVNRQ